MMEAGSWKSEAESRKNQQSFITYHLSIIKNYDTEQILFSGVR